MDPRVAHTSNQYGVHRRGHSTKPWEARVVLEAWQEPALSPVAGAATSRFVKLFEVVLEHAYYNGTIDQRCPGFDVYPNARTVALMRSLGLLFRNDGTSFSVLCDVARLGYLAHYLDSDRTDEGERWTHLSFFLAANRALLINVTDIAPDADVLEYNLYFRSDEATLVSPGDNPPLTVARPAIGPGVSSIRVRPARFAIRGVPPGGRVEVADQSKEVFLTVDQLPEDPRWADQPLPPVQLDLSGTYEGYNLLTVRGPDGAALHGKDSIPFIYTLAHPSPLCYMHVFFSRPRDSMEGVYPVALDTSGKDPRATITPTHFRLRFAERSARWAYHVFSSVPLASFTSLSIAGSQPADRFSPWQVETLPNGREAALIVSTDPMPLHERSAVRLELRGSVLGGDERVLVDRLPVASADQVPRTGDGGDVFTDIYVHL